MKPDPTKKRWKEYSLLAVAIYLTGVYSGIIIPKHVEQSRQPTVVPAQHMNLHTLETLEYRRAEPDFVEL